MIWFVFYLFQTVVVRHAIMVEYSGHRDADVIVLIIIEESFVNYVSRMNHKKEYFNEKKQIHLVCLG